MKLKPREVTEFPQGHRAECKHNLYIIDLFTITLPVGSFCGHMNLTKAVCFCPRLLIFQMLPHLVSASSHPPACFCPFQESSKLIRPTILLGNRLPGGSVGGPLRSRDTDVPSGYTGSCLLSFHKLFTQSQVIQNVCLTRSQFAHVCPSFQTRPTGDPWSSVCAWAEKHGEG